MADRQTLIDGLNEDLNLELEAVLRYMYHAAVGHGAVGARAARDGQGGGGRRAGACRVSGRQDRGAGGRAGHQSPAAAES